MYLYGDVYQTKPVNDVLDDPDIEYRDISTGIDQSKVKNFDLIKPIIYY